MMKLLNRNSRHVIFIFSITTINGYSQNATINYYSDSNGLLEGDSIRSANTIEITPQSINDTLRLDDLEVARLLSIKNINSLTIYNSCISQRHAKWLRSINAKELVFNECTFIGDLSLSDKVSAIQIVNSMINNINLKSFNKKSLKSFTLTGSGLSKIPKWLLSHKRLKLLDLSGNNLKIDQINNCRAPLETLILIDCGLYEFQIVKIVEYFPKLRRVEVRNNNINCNQFRSIIMKRKIEADVCN